MNSSPPDAQLGQAVGVAKPEANYIVGRLMMPDGTPLTGDIKDITITIDGVSDAAEKVSYNPAVKPDGTFRQKVAGGQYTFGRSVIQVAYGNTLFDFPLEPKGNLWNKNQDAAEGINQDFVWKVTGATPYGQSSGLDPTNATHWYGMSIGMRADGFRNDINKVPSAIPKDTKLIFTVKPTGKAIDGRELSTLTFERTSDPAGYRNADLNDLVPATYELTGTAMLPNGTAVPLLLQGPGDYPQYKPTLQILLEKDNILNGMFKPLCTYVID